MDNPFIGRRQPKAKVSFHLPDGWHDEDVADMLRFSHASSSVVGGNILTLYFDQKVPASVLQRAKSFNWKVKE